MNLLKIKKYRFFTSFTKLEALFKIFLFKKYSYFISLFVNLKYFFLIFNKNNFL